MKKIFFTPCLSVFLLISLLIGCNKSSDLLSSSNDLTNTIGVESVNDLIQTSSLPTPDFSQYFDYTGSLQSFTVPENIYLIGVDAVGGGGGAYLIYSTQGGYGYISAGGYSQGGTRVQTLISVTPGQVLYVNVGGGGESVPNLANRVPLGGYNGGINGTAYNFSSANGGAGGGATDIRTNSNENSKIVIARGGNGQGTGPGRGGGWSNSWSNYISSSYAQGSPTFTDDYNPDRDIIGGYLITPNNGFVNINFYYPKDRTFYYNGSVQTFKVPPSVTSMTVEALGAAGGAYKYTINGITNTNFTSIGGSRIIATVPVTAGDWYSVKVGGGGQNAYVRVYLPVGGYNGGGEGTAWNYTGSGGGSGGGATTISNNNNNIIIVSARGGNGGGYNPGIGGGGTYTSSNAYNVSSSDNYNGRNYSSENENPYNGMLKVTFNK